MEDNDICPICCDRYTPHLRRRVECLHCSHACCRNCISQYVITSPFMPRCMSCKKGWDRNFMYNTMTKTFVVETLKQHSEKLMLEREKALLPLTQPIVERLKRINELNLLHNVMNRRITLKRGEEREAMFVLRRTRSELVANGLRMRNQEIEASEMPTDSDQSDDERQEIRKQQSRMPIQLQANIQNWKQLRRERIRIEQEREANYRAIDRLVRKNANRINALENHADGNGNMAEYNTSSSEDEGGASTSAPHKTSRRAFVRSCPNDSCKGFLSTRWACGLCGCNVCPKCHEIKTECEVAAHTCDPNNVATAQMLMNDTRGCPSCGVQIHKIDGCNMMFCTQCHTPFCWKTGEIIKNQRIHNPHYYEWLRQNSRDGNIPREPGDEIGGGNANGCYNRISIRAIRDKLERYDLMSYDLEDILWNVHRMNLHIEMVEIPRLNTHARRDHVDLRIGYMMNRCTEREWKHELYRRAKRDEKNASIRQIYEMVNAVLNDELHKIISTEPLEFQNITDCLFTIENLRNYTNQQFLDISRIYQCRVPMIEEQTWNITYQRADFSVRKKPKFKEDAT